MGELLRNRRIIRRRALIGFQFVAMALVSDLPRTPGQAQAGHAFATPNIVHFGAVLFLAAALCAPWHGIGTAAWGEPFC